MEDTFRVLLHEVRRADLYVLILVVMEDGLGEDTRLRNGEEFGEVLILVVMEDGLGELLELKISGKKKPS